MSDPAEPAATQEDSIDPKTFVQNIRELGKKRDEEDAERHRVLEEQILQGRTERAARRAERRRTLSISPDKRYSSGSLRSIDSPRSPHDRFPASPTRMEPPSQPGSPGDALKRLTEADGVENATSNRASASSLSRSGTLSWQQRRPASSNGRRPLSMLSSSESTATRPLPSAPNDAPPAHESDSIPRTQIAQSLSSKDPSWFKQTADRGRGSAAYRKSEEETPSEAGSLSSRTQLPGMSRESRAEASESTPPGSARSSSVSRGDSVRDSAWSARFSANTSLSGFSNRDSKSPLPVLESQRFPAPGSDRPQSSQGNPPSSPERGMAMSSAQGRITQDRSPSPTKGMGGFVQSAMMKRTESMNKRWSQQTPGRLSRKNSTASNTSGFDGGLFGAAGAPKLESSPMGHSPEHSTEPLSRPTSSHSNLTITHGGGADKSENGDNDGFVRPSTPRSLHSRGKSLSALRARASASEDQSEGGSPVSPSKRFSPTKSTWLESALNRPESPSRRPRAPEPQPSWMAEINKNKAQRASVDFSQRGSVDAGKAAGESPAWVRGQVSRGSALGSAGQSPSVEPVPAEETPGPEKQPPRPAADTSASPPKPTPITLSTEGMDAASTTETVVSPAAPSEKPPPAVKSPSLRSPTSPLESPAKPAADSPPKRDFRAGLKSRQLPASGPKKEDPEFLNAFGKLKKAQPERYVAPDVLKGNIVRGKDGLNKTDGPKPRERKDELRQSLIAQKEAMKAKTEEAGTPHRRNQSSVSAASPAVPEALAKRGVLGRNQSISNASPSSPVSKDPPTPEAIARQKYLRERSKSSVSEKPKDEPVKPLSRQQSSQESPKDEVPKPLSRQPSMPDKPAGDPVKPLARRQTPPTDKATEDTAKPSPKRQPSLPDKPKDESAEPARPSFTRKPTLSADKPKDEPAESPKPFTRKPTLPADTPKDEPTKPLATEESSPVDKPVEESTKPAPKRQPSLPNKPKDEPAEPVKPAFTRKPTLPADKPKDEAAGSPKPFTRKPTLPADKPKDEPAKPSWKRQTPPADKPKDETPKPLARRPTQPLDKAAEEPTMPAWKKQLLEKSKNASAKPSAEKSPPPTEKPKEEPLKPWQRQQALPGMAKDETVKPLSRQPSMPETPKDEPVKPLSRQPSSPEKPADEATPSKTTSRMSAKLADRFNPALAGILARGPAGNSTANRQSGGSPSGHSTTADESTTSAPKELTHITKGRARGPKRRAPAAKKETEAEKSPPVAAVPLVKPKDMLPSTEAKEESVVTPKPVRVSGSFPSKQKPTAPAKSPEVAKRISSMSLSSPKLEKDAEAATGTAVPEATSELDKRSSLRKSQPEKPASPKPALPEAEKTPMPAPAPEKPASPKPTSPQQSAPKPSFQSRFKQDTPAPLSSPSPKTATAELPKATSPPPSAPVVDETKQEKTEPKSLVQSRFDKDARPPIISPGPKPTPFGLAKAVSPLPSPPATEEPKQDNTESKPAFQSRFNKDVRPPFGSPSPKPTPVELPKAESPLPTPPSTAESKYEKVEPKPLFQSRFNQATRPSMTSPGAKPLPAEPQKTTKALPSPPVTEETKEEKVERTSAGSSSSVKSAAAIWGNKGESTSPTMTRTKSPIKLPTRKDEETAKEDAGLVRPEPPPKGPVGLGLGNISDAVKPSPLLARKPMERKPIEQPKLVTPPLSGGLPLKPERKPTRSSDPISPVPHSSEAGQLFADFFDETPKTNGKLDLDTNAILNNNVLDQGKTKTTRKQMQEITGDGKLSPIPEPEQHMLYDESMYLCTHTFTTATGSRTTEVYLWTGASVPEPTVEDAQLFARRAAKDAGGQLLIIKQGKETPNFFQALGGILIVRKGSRLEHSNQYMLCGRQHLGHMAFDEVELSLSNLCSGFPYLVSSRSGLLSGSVFLWRGLGCNAEELGCARLIGMDLGLTPEIIEVDEGKEPQSFLSIFPDPATGPKKVPRSASHWELKPKHAAYAVRLFRVDERQAPAGGFQVSSLWPTFMRRVSSQSLPSPTSVSQTPPPQCEIAEIAPFNQMDLEAEHIYVLDAFFEMYIIVGALSSSQSHAFSTALLFAQEYGILAASLQDRPFVPVSTVVLEGVPRDMKAVFRRWTDAALPTSALMAGKPRRGKSLRIVPLSAAIAATRE